VANSKGFVKLRRGIFDHLQIMSATELKVYIALLVLADYKNGSVNISISDLSESIGVSYKPVQVSVKRLVAMKYINFIPSRNQWQDSNFEICKYASVELTEAGTEATPIASVELTEAGTEATPIASVELTEAGTEASTEAQAQDQQKQASKNLKNLKNLKELKDNRLSARENPVAVDNFSGENHEA